MSVGVVGIKSKLGTVLVGVDGSPSLEWNSARVGVNGSLHLEKSEKKKSIGVRGRPRVFSELVL